MSGNAQKMAHIDYYLATISPNCYFAGTRPGDQKNIGTRFSSP